MVYIKENSGETWAIKSLSRRPKNIPVAVVDAQKVEHLKTSLFGNQRQSSTMRDEKLRLHLKSVEKTKNWGKTVMGDRRKRIEAIKEKERLAEEERKRIDDEWHAIKDRERQEAIAKAKQMRYQQTPIMREINSGALLCNVLRERDLQVMYKHQKQAMQKQIKDKQDRSELLKWAEEELRQRHREAESIKNKLSMGEERRQVLRQRENERKLKESEPDPYLGPDGTWDSHFRQAESTAVLIERARQKREALRHDLETVIGSKKEFQSKLEEEEMTLTRDCEAHADLMNRLEEQRKAVEKSSYVARTKISETVAAQSKLLQDADKQKVTEFIENNSKHDRMLQSHALTVIQRKQLADDTRTYLKSKLNEKNKFLERAAAENKQWGEHIRSQAMQEILENKEKDRKFRADALQISVFNRNMGKLKGEELKAFKLYEKYHWAQSDVAENDKLRNYANELISQLKAESSNVRPIEKILDKYGLNEEEFKANPQAVNTFNRLGFIKEEVKATPLAV